MPGETALTRAGVARVHKAGRQTLPAIPRERLIRESEALAASTDSENFADRFRALLAD